jgi:outer membrane lipoprotein-sorting protein
MERDRELGQVLLSAAPPEGRPDFGEAVIGRFERELRRARRRRARARLLAVAAAAVVIVTLVIFLALPPGKVAGPPQALAAQVAGRMAAAPHSVTTLQGRFTSFISDWGASSVSGSFMADAHGNFRSEETIKHAAGVSGPTSQVLIYNAKTHTKLIYSREEGRLTGHVERGFPPGVISADAGFAAFAAQGYASDVRAALDSGDPPATIKETTFDGRRAWRVVFPTDKGAGFFKGIRVTVDQETGVLLQYVHEGESPGDAGYRFTLSKLRVDEEIPPDAFATQAPAGALITERTARSYCTLRQVAERVGYQPLVPTSLPGGYHLADVATYRRPGGAADLFQGPYWSVTDAAPHNEVFLRYRAGLSVFSIQVAPVLGSSPLRGAVKTVERWSTSRSTVLKAGPFAGRTALTWFWGLGASLLVFDDQFGVLIAGDLTRQELIGLAQSLQTYQQ